MMRTWKLWVASGALGVAVMLAVLGGSPGANATPRSTSRRIPPPPPVPRIVNPDGSLDWAALDKIPVWEPRGYKGPTVYASTLMRQRLADANLTPAEIARMTPGQRAAHYLSFAP
jgi:hypothetical protein